MAAHEQPTQFVLQLLAGAAAPPACMMRRVGDQPSAHCPSYSGHHSTRIAPMRGSSIRPSGLGPGIPGRNAYPPTGTRLPSRLSSRGPEWPKSRPRRNSAYSEKLELLCSTRCSLDLPCSLANMSNMGGCIRERCWQTMGWGKSRASSGPSSGWYLRLTGSRHITSLLPLFFTLLFLSEPRTTSLPPLHL